MNSALETKMFEQWATANQHRSPLRLDQIVGYRIPLSLGGKHELSNLVIADSEVDLELDFQIQTQIRDLADGTTIKGIVVNKQS
jgi:hypothetical protein